MMDWVDKVIEEYERAGVEVTRGFSGPEGVGEPPSVCPFCEKNLREDEMLGSGDTEIDIVVCCPDDNHPVVWHTGESYRVT